MTDKNFVATIDIFGMTIDIIDMTSISLSREELG